MSSINLTHHFLIAMPNMADPYFSRTLTYICEHNDQGALGLVVNRPIDMTLQALFERLSLTLRDGYLAAAPIYFGGPVQTDRGFVLHEPAGNWQSTLRVRDVIGLTTSKDILEAVATKGGPPEYVERNDIRYFGEAVRWPQEPRPLYVDERHAPGNRHAAMIRVPVWPRRARSMFSGLVMSASLPPRSTNAIERSG